MAVYFPQMLRMRLSATAVQTTVFAIERRPIKACSVLNQPVGVEFIDENGGGQGVRLKKSDRGPSDGPDSTLRLPLLAVEQSA